jgi:hypothetical protein
MRTLQKAFAGSAWQSVSILFCVLFGLAMIVNTQLQGEAEWFWYARLLHSGSKLYADLHLALQPLIVLETDAWIQMFGVKCLVTEIPGLLHLLAFCLAILLILRESDWPDWQKAIVLAGAFLISVECSAYRFDDFHVVADTFVFYSVAVLLLLARADTVRRQFGLTVALGVLSGLAITTRLNDGGALIVAVGACLLVLAPSKKILLAGLFVAAAAVTWVFIVKLTGDSLSEYARNSIFKAAGAKGGMGSISTAPFRILPNVLKSLHGTKWIVLWTAAIIAATALLQRFRKNTVKYMIVLQLALAGFAYLCSSWLHRIELREGAFFLLVILSLFLLNYLLVAIVAARYLISKTRYAERGWDAREILILVPLAELASTSASAGATTIFFLSPIALLLLLMPVIQPLRRQAGWANATLVTTMMLLGLFAVSEKTHNPYRWLHFQSKPMFADRQWYWHPVYGPMYMEKDQLDFILPVCRDIKAGNPKPTLLSMPWSYPNYFCNTPPWHGYVQTFFDTSTQSTIEQLMRQLNTEPPQWIVYERDTGDLTQHERILNGGRPLPHRYLDDMMMQKIETHQWELMGMSDYLFPESLENDGWYIIRTRP